MGQFVDTSNHIIVSVDEGNGARRKVEVVSVIDLLNSFITSGLVNGEDSRTVLEMHNGIHANSFMGSVYNMMITIDKKSGGKLLTVHNRYKLRNEDEEELRRLGVQFNKEMGSGDGNKDYRPLYDVRIIPNLFQARIVQAMGEIERGAFHNPNYAQERRYWDTVIDRFRVEGVQWTGKEINASHVIVLPHATEKEMSQREKKFARREGKRPLI